MRVPLFPRLLLIFALLFAQLGGLTHGISHAQAEPSQHSEQLLPQDNQKMPRRKFIGVSTQEYRFSQYLEDWRVKVERIGNLNYPEQARQQRLSGKLQLSVSIKTDGTLETVEVSRSSGHRILDAAAVRIVKLAAPYSPLPPDITVDTDILTITRTWTFTSSDRLEGE